jgi:hypothetical protein
MDSLHSSPHERPLVDGLIQIMFCLKPDQATTSLHGQGVRFYKLTKAAGERNTLKTGQKRDLQSRLGHTCRSNSLVAISLTWRTVSCSAASCHSQPCTRVLFIPFGLDDMPLLLTCSGYRLLSRQGLTSRPSAKMCQRYHH